MVSEHELRGLIYGAMFGENDWGAFLERFSDLVPECKTTLFYHDARLWSGSYTLSRGMPNDMRDSYAAYYAPKNPWMKGATTRPLGLVVSDQYMVGRKDLRRTEFYNDWLRPQNIEGCIGVTLYREGSHNSFLAITTPHANAHEEKGVMRTLARIVPDMRRVFRHYRQSGSPTPSAGEVAAPNLGVLSIGIDRKVKSMNELAARIFDKTPLLSTDPQGRFNSSDVGFVEWIDHCLKLWGWPHITPPVRSFLLGNAPDLPMRVTVIPTHIDQAERYFRGPECHLVIEPPPSRTLSINQVQAFYGLTRAEARVCVCLAAGATPSEIAERHGVGIETVRSQLKSAYQKTGMSKQSDLVWLITKFADHQDV
jgi:DNA-binding CsgD family transcriptional regulator